MNISYDDYEQFVGELTDTIETGITYEHDEPVGYDATRATMNVLDLMQRWGLLFFMDEN
jgi:hypothetical protein